MSNELLKPVPESLTEFVENYLPMKLRMNWHHRLFYNILENKIIQRLDKDGKLKLFFNVKKYRKWVHGINKNIIVLAPRFHSKSTCFTINYPIWEIYRNPNIRILIVSANEDIAISFNRAIINNLENNTALIDNFGYLVPQTPKKWGERAFIVKRTTMEKDPTVAAIGAGGKLISRRADIIIVDDLLDINNARSNDMRKKTLEWFENVLLPILEDDGRLIIVGTSWYRNDLYDTLLNDSNFDVRLKLKALIYDENVIKNEGKLRYHLPYNPLDFPLAQKIQEIMSMEIRRQWAMGKKLMSGVLWEEKWSFEKLMKKKENMSNASFMRQYLNEPVVEEDKVFRESAIKNAIERGSQKSLLPEWDNLHIPFLYNTYGHLVVAIGVDLAISKSKDAANSAIAVWGLNDKRERILLWLDYGKWNPEETKQKIVDAYYAFHPVKIRVETIAFQDMIRQELSDEIPIEGFKTTASKKFNPETGIAHIAMLMEQNKIIIPSAKANRESFNKVRQLLYEMSVYTYNTHAGDLLMASWFALDVLRDFDSKVKENRGFFDTGALVDQMRSVRAPTRILLFGYNPPVYRLGTTSLVSVFVPIDAKEYTPFFEENDKFFIFVTREQKTVAYIFNKLTSEVIGKIDGDINALMCATLLEKAGYFFNKAQIVVERSGEGDAIFIELTKRNYPNLLCMQPDDNGFPTVREGFKITVSNLPIIMDYFKQIVDGRHIKIPDEQVIKEMGELISVEGDKLIMSFGTGQRLKTIATGFWILDNYENSLKKLYNGKMKKNDNKKKKELNVPYLVFR
jgi:hypothetical protein